jgi:Na+/H+ antiporter NhaD/arsenite permease-like protein
VPLSTRAKVVGFVLAIAIAWLGFSLEHLTHDAPDAVVALPWVAPFVALLACIAIMPFTAKHFWEHHYHHVAMGLGALVAIYYLIGVEHGAANVGRSAAEYVSFIFLLASLYVVSGGILIRVRARATPMANVVLLAIGAVIANVFGTTGASMLLIRPYLRMNRGHVRPYHVVFFIFVVANAGGSLTPIGDPPLFLGYLQGVPFFWVFEHCWPIWALVNGLLLATFFAFDLIHAKRDGRSRADDPNDLGPAVSFYGATNLLLIAVILAGILLHGQLNHYAEEHFGFAAPWREMTMAAAAFASLAITPRRVHGENAFNYAPIKEVAYLFVGIFLTMVPALNYLYHNAQKMHLNTPGQYYFSAGALSSVLDNAPTYLTFLKTELGTLDKELVQRERQIIEDPSHEQITRLEGLTDRQVEQVRDALAAVQKYHPDQWRLGRITEQELQIANLVGDHLLNRYLVAISMGAVLFGAMTYIGNGPNFMVKSIAESAGAPTPSFFRYVYAFAVPILLPILILVWAIFLR